VFLIIAYTFSSTKLEIRAKQILPESEGVGGEGGGGGVQGGEMTQTMYVHVNKRIKKMLSPHAQPNGPRIISVQEELCLEGVAASAIHCTTMPSLSPPPLSSLW
jgi:hypothetical protein